MALLVCAACERQRIIEKLIRNNYTCVNCGAKNALIIRRKNLWASWSEKSGKIKIEAMRDTYAGLRKIAEFKKFKPKYADAKFRSIFGIWPPDAISEVPPEAPGKALLQWIKKSNEAWKKQKRADEAAQKGTPEVVLRLPALQEEESCLWTPSFMTPEDWEVKL